MPRISVVVPIYEVEPYLAACLQSLARQTVADLEVVMVDDGSTDGSAAIAQRFCDHDARFRLLRQPNAGLGAARNAGVAAAGGEFLAFVDSDDVLPANAHELLLGALDATGSDFASGNVRRLAGDATTQAAFLARTFARTRLGTHVTRFRPLLSDRTAWNKLWRRSFWEERALRFPEGVVHEDIPVTLPAHFEARAVDVVAAPVYLYRTRDDGRSITQRRLEHRVLRDRLAAIEHVRDYLARSGRRRAARWYDERIVADDLRLHLNILDAGDADYQELFLARVNAMLDGAAPGIFAGLPAIDRLKWHLVRRRLLPELLEVLRFQREEGGDRPPLRRRGRWYGDYPFRDDRRLAVPRSTYRLGRRDEDLALRAHLEDARVEGERLTLRGHASIAGLGAGSPDAQRLAIAAVRRGRWRRLRMRVAPLRLATVPALRPELGAEGTGAPDRSWAGYAATLRAADLRGRGWADGRWQLYADVRSRGLRRRRAQFELDAPELVGALTLPGCEGALVRATTGADGAVELSVSTRWLCIRGHRLSEDDTLELWGDARLGPDPQPGVLELRRESDGHTFAYPLAAGERFRLRLPLADPCGAEPSLQARADPEPGAQDRWELSARSGGRRLAVALPRELAGTTWSSDARDLALVATLRGDAALLVERERRPLLAAPRFGDEAALRPDRRQRAGASVPALIRGDAEWGL